MAIDYDTFLAWAESRFENIKANGKEIMVNSPFPEMEGMEPDHKTHLYCNVDGGKHQRENGVYRCWKTDKTGTLLGLVMQVDHCDVDEAIMILKGHNDLSKRYSELEDILKNKKVEEKKYDHKAVIEFPEYTYSLAELTGHHMGMSAIAYLKRRKLPWEELFFCVAGDYKNRIIIPYYDDKKRLIYWNGRQLNPKAKPKYLGPDREIYGVGKGDVLYITKYPPKGSFIFITEGEFDAMSLGEIGFPAGAVGGKSISPQQLELLAGYKICLAVDNDKYFKNTTRTMGDLLHERGFEVDFVKPPEPYKDWNSMRQEKEPQEILKSIQDTKQNYSVKMWEMR